jgi:hypothetical protein
MALFLLLICVVAATDSSASSAKQLETELTGKLVARVDGPPLTGFGANRQSYIFEMYSPTGSQFVRLSYTFFIYEPQLPPGAFDYSKLYKVTAVKDDTCQATLEKISQRFVFDSRGQFVGVTHALTYSRNFPSLAVPWDNPLLCYVLSPVRPPANVLTESNPSPAPQ